MEGNRGEAERCLGIAARHLAKGDFERATKFAAKSEKLFPSPKSKQFMARVAKAKAGPSAGAGAGAAPSPGASNRRTATSTGAQANVSSASNRKAPQPSTARKATPQQLADTRRIMRAKDFYEVLGVQRNVEAGPLKKTYHKLARTIHPDKNSAPQAEEAFKRMNTAYKTLSDSRARRTYDLTGQADGQPRAQHRNDFQGMSPEDLLNQVFNGGFRRGGFPGGFQTNFQRQRRQHRPHNPDDNDQRQGPNALFFMFLMVLMFTFFSSSITPAATEQFSLRQTSMHTHRLTISYDRDITYWVTEALSKVYHQPSQKDRRTIAHIEASVLQLYEQNVRERCYKERNHQRRVTEKAKYFRDNALLARAQALKTPNCDLLSAFVERHSTARHPV